MTREKALQMRAMIEKASVSLSDEDALAAVELFPAWAADTAYAADQRVRYGGKLYRCVQSHTSQAGWEPDKTPALWTEVAKPGEIPVWRHPHRFRRTLATNLIGRGMPIQNVAVILGHDKLGTTMKYVYLDKADVRNSYKRYM